ncbi:hypothetical protein AX15_005885 [Amanita polypyramis BW_CC]|nr:hypothetical protein AX15_005885 [Amanita polypyramis BW_CC]
MRDVQQGNDGIPIHSRAGASGKRDTSQVVKYVHELNGGVLPNKPDMQEACCLEGGGRNYVKGATTTWARFWALTLVYLSLAVIAPSAFLSFPPISYSLNCLQEFVARSSTSSRFNSITNVAGSTYSVNSLFQSDVLTDQVKFDNYSLILRGQRVFLYSGEFHTFRLPIPSLWPDILQKIKAAGLNAISVYTHMGLINPSRGVIDFNDFRALQPLYDAAREAGVWIVLRPGPYINAETTAGGIAHWVTTEVAGQLRTNATDYKAAWEQYIQGIIDETVPNQITNGGPVIAIQIDNEYEQFPIVQAEYFAELEAAYRASPIVVPLTYNDPGEGRNFINGTGAVDLYGFDSYPQGFDCSHPTRWKPLSTNYHSYHMTVNPSQPLYIPEFQGGSYDAWGPSAPGYAPCRVLTGPDFQSVFNLQLWASNSKLISYYMVYGGTSWGGLPFPGVYTSYDYGASITEARDLTTKYDELKRQALFLRSSPSFYKTNWIADSSTGLDISTSSAAYTTLLRNPDANTSFYIARQATSTSTTTTAFKLTVQTIVGAIQIPRLASNITLGGRQSKVIVTDYSFGQSSKLLYSTAQIFFAGVIGGRDILVVYGDSTQEHEFAYFGPPAQPSTSQILVTRSTSLQGDLNTVFVLPRVIGQVTVVDSATLLVMYVDSVTAATFWAPIIAGDPSDPLRNYWSLGTNQTVLVGGPYFVRNASISGNTLALRGDLKVDVMLTVIAPSNVMTVTWNGQVVDGIASASSVVSKHGAFVGQLQFPPSLTGISVPALTGWMFHDSLPEIQSSYDDSTWVTANHTETNIPFKPYYGDGRVLHGCDYGFCENVVLWRGHFNASGREESVNLTINGGEAFAASVWLNGAFLGTSFGNSTNNGNIVTEVDSKFTFPASAVRPSQDNVITIVQDNMGLDEYESDVLETIKSPRGIRGYKLNDGTFTTWKVQGKVGGYKGYLDKVRGVFNEGGLFGERKGWHLPGFPVSSASGWTARDLSQGMPNSTAGVGFFVTNFTLNIPQGVDAMMSFTFQEPFGQPYRSLLFVNGWMMGKRVGNLGPQSKFPIHEGILNYRGDKYTASLVLFH